MPSDFPPLTDFQWAAVQSALRILKKQNGVILADVVGFGKTLDQSTTVIARLGELREFGLPAQPLDIQGDIAFTSYFFDPKGSFRTQLNYPNMSAQLELGISRGMTVWQVDTINMTWNPPPGASPTPTPTPVPTPTPTPEPKRKRKNG